MAIGSQFKVGHHVLSHAAEALKLCNVNAFQQEIKGNLVSEIRYSLK